MSRNYPPGVTGCEDYFEDGDSKPRKGYKLRNYDGREVRPWVEYSNGQFAEPIQPNPAKPKEQRP